MVKEFAKSLGTKTLEHVVAREEWPYVYFSTIPELGRLGVRERASGTRGNEPYVPPNVARNQKRPEFRSLSLNYPNDPIYYAQRRKAGVHHDSPVRVMFKQGEPAMGDKGKKDKGKKEKQKKAERSPKEKRKDKREKKSNQ